MKPFANENYSTTLAPWSPVHPRNDHQLIFPLSDDRLLFVWCAYYVMSPSCIFDTPYTEHRTMDASPCRIQGKVSCDQGRTWSAELTLQDNVGVDNVKHPNLLRLPSGRILFTYTVRNIEERDLRVYLKYSDDECDSFSEPRQISPDAGVYFTNADHILQHSSGRIILPCHAGPFYGPGDHWTAFCLYSDDEGETWHESSKQMDLPKRGAEEPAVVERRDGSLLAILRTSLGTLYRGFSYDRGQTWTDPEDTGITSPSVATALKRIPRTGDLLLLWNNTKPYWQTVEGSTVTHQPRNPLTAAISEDDGETWQYVQDIEDRAAYDSGYPSVSFVGDEVFVTYYSNVKSGLAGIQSEVILKVFPTDWFYSE